MPARTVAAATVIGLLGLAALIGTGMVLSPARSTATDGILAQSYGQVLADSDTSWSTLPSNLHLSSLGAAPVSTGALSPGDTISINGRDGRPEVIDVVDIEVMDGEAIGAPGVRFQLVTGRSRVQRGDGLVRLMFAVPSATERAPSCWAA